MMDDENIIKKFRQTDQKTILKFFKEHEDSFFLFAKKMASVIQDNEINEIYNEANYRLYKNIKDNSEFELTNNSSLKSYLFGIGTNVIYSTLRKKQTINRRELIVDTSLDNLIDIIGGENNNSTLKILDRKNELISIISDFVSKMKEPCKKILELRYFDGLRLSDMLNKLESYSGKQSLSRKIHSCLKKAENALSEELESAGFKFNESKGQWI